MISDRIASAFVDGEDVSWSDAAHLAETPRERQLVADLCWLASVSAPVAAAPVRPVASVPLWASIGTFLAQIQSIAALTLAFRAVGTSRFAVAQVLLVISFAAAGVILWYGGRHDTRARWLGLAYLLTAASFAHPLLLAARLGGVAALLLVHASVDAFIPLSLWQFALMFPRTERLSAFDRIARPIVTTCLVIGAGLFVSNVVLYASPSIGRTSLALLSRDHQRWTFWAIVYPFALSALIVPPVRTHISRVERRRVWLFMTFLVGGMMPILVSGLTEQFAPTAAIWTRSAAGRASVDALVLGSLLTVPPGTTYAIFTRQVLSVRLVIERATRYMLARSSLVVLITIPAGLLGWFLFVHRDESLATVLAGRRGSAIALWLVVSAAALVARQQLLALVDKAFKSGPLDHAQALAASLAALRGAVGVTSMIGILADEIRRLFGSTVSVLRLEPSGDAVLLYGESGPLPASSAIVAVAQSSTEPISLHVADLSARLLPTADRAWVDENEIDAVLPLHRADGETLALLVVGPKRDCFPWSSRDLSWLSALGDAAALALETALADIERSGATADHWNASECGACGLVQVHALGKCACGGSLRPSLLPSSLHGKFAVERWIGRGGMGVVYQGRDLVLHRPVALKTLPHLDPEAAARIRTEARTMGAMMHPNLATIFGMETWQRTPVLVLEWLPRGTLGQRLRREAQLPVAEAVRLCDTLAAGLSALHAAGLVHGDVKPSNIGFTADNTPKLLDFGLTFVVGSANAEGGTVAGTPPYMPPEGFDDEPPSVAFDLWGLSVVLFEALTGRNPFTAPTLGEVRQRVRSSTIPDARTWRADVPKPLAMALGACLQRDAARRPQSAAQWRQTIEDGSRLRLDRRSV